MYVSERERESVSVLVVYVMCLLTVIFEQFFELEGVGEVW